ncbi:unnamed protein product, partial [Mesorhabditis belari]|uniref:Vesicle transport protein n=1 Tax=Mesorhabditis belari TaxID=2138241 RepID=A0AAF3F679_9BILA
MSTLEAYVNEQKKKGNLGTSASFSSLGDLRNKFSTSISIGRLFNSGDASDAQSLVDDGTGVGQLSQGKNRKNGGGMFSWFSSADEGMCGLSRMQRMVAFIFSLLGAGICFITAAVLIPVIVLPSNTRKFAALNSLGSVMLILSFAFLWGPYAYFTHILSPQRRLVTVAYFSALFATLYSSLMLKSFIFTFIAAIFQTCTLVWFVLSYVPGGERGLRWITSIFTGFITTRSATVLPI